MKLFDSFPFIKTSKTAPTGKVVSADERRELVSEAFKSPPIPNTKARNWIEFVSDFKLTKLVDYDSYMRAGTSKVWASFHAVDTIAKGLVSVPFIIKKGDKKIDNENDPLLKLIAEPNPFDSWEEIIHAWTFHMEYTGNAYWLKDEIDGKGRPTSVYPLLPQFIEVIPDAKTRVRQYIYRVNGRSIIIEPDEMLHFKSPHPNNVIFGLGKLEAGELMFEDYINRNTLERHYMSKGGVPSGVLVREEEVEDPEEWKSFVSRWKNEYEGIGNTGKTAFLNGKWNYVKLGLTPVELQTMARSEMTVKNIFTLHGVPLSVAGVERAANYATSRQDSIHFKRWTLMPLLDMLCTRINAGKSLARNYDPSYRLSYELKGLADVGGIVQEYGPMVDKGALTRNELRELCELEKVKGKPMMDEFLVAQGLVPIDMAGMGGGMDESLLDAAGNPINSDDEEEEEEGSVYDRLRAQQEQDEEESARQEEQSRREQFTPKRK
jgi:HK97 family phage portal protein